MARSHLDRTPDLRARLCPRRPLPGRRGRGGGPFPAPAPEGPRADPLQEVLQQGGRRGPGERDRARLRGVQGEVLGRRGRGAAEGAGGARRGRPHDRAPASSSSSPRSTPCSSNGPTTWRPQKGGEKPYAVLREALLETKRVGIARFYLRTRPLLAALLPGPELLALDVMRESGELRSPKGLDVPKRAVRAPEIKMARMLIEQMAGEFDPTEHPNVYRKALEKLLASKRRFELEGGEEEAGRRKAKVVDLMARSSAASPRLARDAGRRRASIGLRETTAAARLSGPRRLRLTRRAGRFARWSRVAGRRPPAWRETRPGGGSRLLLEVAMAREDYDGDVCNPAVVTLMLAKLPARHPGHVEIEQHHAGPPPGPQHSQRLGAVCRLDDLAAVHPHQLGNPPAGILVVIDQEDLMAVVVGGHDSPSSQSESRALQKARVLGLRTEPIVETPGRPGPEGAKAKWGGGSGLRWHRRPGSGPLGGVQHLAAAGTSRAGRHLHAPAKSQRPCGVAVARDSKKCCAQPPLLAGVRRPSIHGPRAGPERFTDECPRRRRHAAHRSGWR